MTIPYFLRSPLDPAGPRFGASIRRVLKSCAMIETNLWRAAALVALGMNMAGCGDGLGTSPSPVIAGPWKLNAIHIPATNTTTIITRPENYTVTFDKGSRLGIKADCNVCGGSYSLSGGAISIRETFCTLAYCGDTSNDRAFLDVLNNATNAGVSGDILTIRSPKGEARFTR